MALENKYVLQTYARYPLAVRRGREAATSMASMEALSRSVERHRRQRPGHAHPRITKVIRHQAGQLLHTSNLYYHEFTGKLAEKLAKRSRSWTACSSATRAPSPMEGALKIVKSHGHGVTFGQVRDHCAQLLPWPDAGGALSITGQPKYQASSRWCRGAVGAGERSGGARSHFSNGRRAW